MDNINDINDIIPIKIYPSDNQWKQMGQNDSSLVNLLSELIDNSLAELLGNLKGKKELVNVTITIGGPWFKPVKGSQELDLSNAFIRVQDDAGGIPYAKLGICLSPAALACAAGGGMHEHGMGMKTAISSLCEFNEFYILTKTEDAKYACKIDDISYERTLKGKLVEVDFVSGTQIYMKGLTGKVYKRKEDYTANVINQLGAYYRIYLERKQLNLIIRLVDENNEIVQDSKGQKADWTIVPVHPKYSPRYNDIQNHKIKGYCNSEYSATLNFGRAPTEQESETLGIIAYGKGHPYWPYNKKIDIIFNDRVIKQADLEQIGITRYSHGHFPLRGELKLEYGFKTTSSKDGIVDDDNWSDLKSKIDEITSPYMKTFVNKESVYISEEEYRDKAMKLELAKGNEAIPEYPVEACDGYVDLLVNKEVWEFKAVQADAQAVYQVLMYVNHGDVNQDTAILWAKGFSTGCQNAAKYVKDNYRLDIRLIDISVLD